MTDPVDINRVPKLNLGLQETDEVFITRQGSGPYRVPASSFPWEQKGDKGDPGGSWAPVLALVTDGVRLVHRVVDWVGGTGEKPTALGYVGATGFVATAAAAVDVRGAQGAAGWAPVLAVVEDGVRRVHQVVDWTGGAGTKPTTLGYVGATGIVETAAAAVDVRGPQGVAGWAPVLAVVADGERRVQQVVDWTGGAGTKPTTLGYVGAAGIVETAAAAVDVRGAPGAAGWAPVLAVVAEGERRVQQVVDWTGGAGTKPATLGYVGAAGIVETAAAAVDVRGAQGAAGWAPVLAVVEDGVRRVQRVVDWTGGAGTKPTTLGYVGAAGIVATAAEAVDVRGPLGAVSAESMREALSVAPVPVLQEISGLVSGHLGNTRILANGDSITNDGVLTTASAPVSYEGGTYTAGGVTEVRTEDHGYTAQASALLGAEIINKGIAGNTIQQVIDRLAADVGPYKPGIVIDNAVTNSLFGTAADAMTEDALYADLVAKKTICIEYYRGIGAKVLIPECLPRSTFTARQNRVAARYNRWLRTLPELQPWIRVAPVAALFSDPAVYGSATPAPRWTRDGTHPNNVGAMRYGKVVATCLDGWVTPDNGLYPSLMDVRGGFGSSAIVRNTNPLMGLGSGGTLGTGATGSIAAEYTINRLAGSPNIACSLVTDADGYQRQRLTVDFLAAGDAIWFGVSPASGIWDTTRASLMSCAADVDIVSGGPEIINSLFMYTTATVGGTAYRSTCLNQNTQSLAARGNLPTGRGVSLRLRSPRIYVPAGACTTYQTQIRMYASAAGQVTLDVGKFYKLQEVIPI